MNVEKNPTGHASIPWVLLALTLITHILVLANPGYFNHDELQRLDDIRLEGLSSYLQRHLFPEPGPHFGHPVRPLGFVQQGLSALAMSRSPILAHGIDVLLHFGVALAFFRLLVHVNVSAPRSATIAAVFVISPLGTVSTAWVGASFDRLYVLFALLCAFPAATMARHGFSRTRGVLLLFASAAAILSKETAALLPVALIIAGLAWRETGVGLRLRPAMAALAISAAPTAAYLLFRASALAGSASGAGGAHAPSIGDVPLGALIYFAYPGLPGAVEAASAPLFPAWQWVLAIGVHAGIIAAIAVKFGLRSGILYLASYFIFLVPVLPLEVRGAHYLYGSGIAFAVAVGALVPKPQAWMKPDRWLRPGLPVVAILLAFLALRSQFIQAAIHGQGTCQSRLERDLEASFAAAMSSGAHGVRIVALDASVEPVARKLLHGRGAYMREGQPRVVVDAAAQPAQGEVVLSLTADCRLLPATDL